MSNPNDEVRDAVLRHLHHIHSKARSPKSAAIGIRDLLKAMKTAGYKQQEVASNLDYLIQKGWVREVIENRTFTTPRGTTQQAEKRSYKISDIGIDSLEGASTYKRPETSPRINITNVQGVTVVGDGNVVNTSFTELSRALNDMRKVAITSSLHDKEKLDVAADIDTLQGQLQKPEPNKSVVKAVWSSIEKVAAIGGFLDLAKKAAEWMGPLIS